MKSILTALILISSATVYSQTFSTQSLNEYFDPFGTPLKANSQLSNSINSNLTAMSTYDYDSVRALSEINDPDTADAYPWISNDGLRLYYTSGDAYTNKIMYTSRTSVNDYFVSPSIIPISNVNPFSFWLSQDELDAYITTSDSLFFTHRNSVISHFTVSTLIILVGGPSHAGLKGASLNSAQDVLFINLSDFSATSIIAEYSRISPDSFSYVRTLPVPMGYLTHPGQLSKDELSIFFSATTSGGFDILYQLTRATPADSFSIGTFQQIQGINASLVYNLQPTMSDSLNWVAFVRNNTGTWQGNELYIAKTGFSTSVSDLDKTKTSVSVFPNPSSGIFQVRVKNIAGNCNDGTIEVYNNIGENIIQQKFANEIDISAYPKGIYFIQVKFKDEIYSEKVVLQ